MPIVGAVVTPLNAVGVPASSDGAGVFALVTQAKPVGAGGGPTMRISVFAPGYRTFVGAVTPYHADASARRNFLPTICLAKEASGGTSEVAPDFFEKHLRFANAVVDPSCTQKGTLATLKLAFQAAPEQEASLVPYAMDVDGGQMLQLKRAKEESNGADATGKYVAEIRAGKAGVHRIALGYCPKPKPAKKKGLLGRLVSIAGAYVPGMSEVHAARGQYQQVKSRMEQVKGVATGKITGLKAVSALAAIGGVTDPAVLGTLSALSEYQARGWIAVLGAFDTTGRFVAALDAFEQGGVRRMLAVLDDTGAISALQDSGLTGAIAMLDKRGVLSNLKEGTLLEALAGADDTGELRRSISEGRDFSQMVRQLRDGNFESLVAQADPSGRMPKLLSALNKGGGLEQLAVLDETGALSKVLELGTGNTIERLAELDKSGTLNRLGSLPEEMRAYEKLAGLAKAGDLDSIVELLRRDDLRRLTGLDTAALDDAMGRLSAAQSEFPEAAQHCNEWLNEIRTGLRQIRQFSESGVLQAYADHLHAPTRNAILPIVDPDARELLLVVVERPEQTTAAGDLLAGLTELSKGPDCSLALAVSSLERAAQAAPDLTWSQLALSVGYQLSGEPDKALQCAQKCTDLDPMFARGWIHLARLYLLKGDNTNASETARKAQAALAKSKENSLYRALGETAYAAGEYEIAGKALSSAVQAGCSDPYVALMLAVCQNRDRLAKDPQDFSACLEMGTALNKAERFQEAREFLEKATGANPKSAEAWQALGTALCGAGGYDEATTALQKSVEAESKNAQARFDLGQLYAALGDPDKAVTHLREAVKCSPENTVFADALELAQSQSMLKSNPADAQALADISLCYYKRAAGLGQDAGTLSERDMFLALADQAAGRSLELMPTCATAKRSLGLVALERGDMQRAIDTLRSACELAPLDSAAHADLGQCYAASSQADLARQCWQKVAQIEGGKRSELSEQAACYLKSR